MMYLNKMTGQILTYREMLEESFSQYDLDDDTNCLGWDEYYTVWYDNTIEEGV